MNTGSNVSPLVSVIVPIYDVEKYLARCLDSIIEQTYQNLEIILVNDGSTDRCGEICLQYAQKDSRIRVFTQENQGLSAARNTGLDNMNGEYVLFVDSDDYVSPYIVETLLDQLLTQRVSIAICNYLEVEDGEDFAPLDVVPADGMCPCQRMGRDEVFDTMGEDCFGRFCAAWGKIYEKRVFENLRFDVGKLYEDAFIFHRVYAQVEWVCYVDLNLCVYRQSLCSITRLDGVPFRMTAVLMEAWLRQLAFFQQRGAEKYVRLTEKRLFSDLALYLPENDISEEKKRQLIKETEAKVHQITGKQYFSWRWMLFRISPKVYWFARKCYVKVKGLKREKSA